MKVVTVIGARPQFIKAAVVSRALRALEGDPIHEVLVHTGQHFSENMSDVFFEEFGMKTPDYNLGIANLSHGAMTAKMLEGLETVLINEQPDMMLIYGDTNSTLAAALAATKLHIPIAHVEAGLRSFNMRMPEEINRILSDRVSSLLLCPTELATINLRNEGLTKGVHLVGDVMYDAVRIFGEIADKKISIETLVKDPDNYIIATLHRAENTDNPDRLTSILKALQSISQNTQVVLPLHPRTRNILGPEKVANISNNIAILEPQPYTEMLTLQRNAKAILTDSGGMQKEAYFHNVPCITLRDETEWRETVDLGWNRVVGADYAVILDAWADIHNYKKSKTNQPYGDGYASEKIAALVGCYQ